MSRATAIGMAATPVAPDVADEALRRVAAALHGKQPDCTADPDLWFPDKMAIEAAPAVAICNRCPAAIACVAYGVSVDARHGVWGGRRFPLTDGATR